MVSDLSPTGLRLHRPFHGKRGEIVQLEFELPGLDEVIWAKGLVCFDRVWQMPSEKSRLLQTTGVKIAAAASSQLKLLREYTMDFATLHKRYSDRRSEAR